MKLNDIKIGDAVCVDDGFLCMKPGTFFIEGDKNGMFIKCCEGNHYLSGQEDGDGNLVGISRAVV